MSNRLIAHLAHVEMLTPKPEESLAFFKDVIGLEESGRQGQSVYLRGWGEWHYHSIELTEGSRRFNDRQGTCWEDELSECLEDRAPRRNCAALPLVEPPILVVGAPVRAYRFYGDRGRRSGA